MPTNDKYDYIPDVPQPLLEEWIDGKWLPIVGAGLSMNAKTPSGEAPPNWTELAERIYPSNPDDSMAPAARLGDYEMLHGRQALLEAMRKNILHDDLSPSEVHLAFARLQFNTIVTTNYDRLIEDAYIDEKKPLYTAAEEGLLAGNATSDTTRLIKMHGDFEHPSSTVVTEDDYDRFLEQSPVMATVVGSLLVDRTGILLGYSISDPNMRQIISSLRNRLGTLSRRIWAIQVRPDVDEMTAFQRRGVDVVSLGAKNPKFTSQSPGEVLRKFFEELKQYRMERVRDSIVTSDDSLTGAFQSPSSVKSFCYFAVPKAYLGWHKSKLYAHVQNAGFVPVSEHDALASHLNSDIWMSLMWERVGLVVVESVKEWLAISPKLRKLGQKLPEVWVWNSADFENESDLNWPRRLRLVPLNREEEDGGILDKSLDEFKAWIEKNSEPDHTLVPSEEPTCDNLFQLLHLVERLNKSDQRRAARHEQPSIETAPDFPYSTALDLQVIQDKLIREPVTTRIRGELFCEQGYQSKPHTAPANRSPHQADGTDGYAKKYKEVRTYVESRLDNVTQAPERPGTNFSWSKDTWKALRQALESDGARPQLKAIRRAAGSKGYKISRDDLFDVAKFDEGRSLRGFSRPITRAVGSVIKDSGAEKVNTFVALYEDTSQPYRCSGYVLDESLAKAIVRAGDHTNQPPSSTDDSKPEPTKQESAVPVDSLKSSIKTVPDQPERTSDTQPSK